MSKKNIIQTNWVEPNKVRLTFETHNGGQMTYEFSGSSARAIKRGTDPGGLMGGRLISHKKKAE